MLQSESVSDLYAALSKAQGQIRDTVKDTQGYGYKYADLAQTLQMIRPILEPLGLCVLQNARSSDVENIVGVSTRVVHSSGQWIETDVLWLPVEAKKGLSMSQCVGIGTTYARRYQLTALFGVAQEDDDASPQGKAPQEPRKQSRPAEPVPTDEEVAAGCDILETAAQAKQYYIDMKHRGVSEKALNLIALAGKALKAADEQADAKKLETALKSIEFVLPGILTVDEAREFYADKKAEGAPKEVLDMIAARAAKLMESASNA